MLSKILAWNVHDLNVSDVHSFENLLSELPPEDKPWLYRWMQFHHKGGEDDVGSLLIREMHLSFFGSLRSGGLIEKAAFIFWSRRIQKRIFSMIDPSASLVSSGHKDVLVPEASCGEKSFKLSPNESPSRSSSLTGESLRLVLGGDSNYKVDGVVFTGGVERIAYKPININNNFHKGFLYYPVQTVRQDSTLRDEKRVLLESLESVVVRSDRVVLTIVESVHPGGAGGKIFRLSDGTLIQRRPSSNGHSSWEWDSIQNFLSGHAPVKDLAKLLDLLLTHLRSRVWLPEDCDYVMLAVAVVVTYTQAIFDSVPLFLLTGPAGSGKSELSGAMAEVSANSVMIGQTSAPTMMRLIDESGGLVIIDDLESVGVTHKPGVKSENVSDIAQALKVSYKKSSATKMITNPKTMQTEILNFYGVKIISNTKSVDDVLGSRMLHIYTQHMQSEQVSQFKDRPKPDLEMLKGIRNDLHIWAFENVTHIRETYLSMYSDKTNRDDEIAAPLRVIARLSGSPGVERGIEEALVLQAARKGAPESPEGLLMDASESLALSGYRSFTITHLMLEMRRMADANFGKDSDTDIPAWNKPEWVGKNLRLHGVIDVKKAPERKRIKGSNLRVVHFSTEFIQRVLKKSGRSFVSVKAPTIFCGECSTCPYLSNGCEIRLSSIA